MRKVGSVKYRHDVFSKLYNWAAILVMAASLSVALGTSAHANPKYAAIVVNGVDGKVLFSRNADARRYPASLTKVMTLYMLFEALEEGRVTLKTKMTVSRRAAGQPPSRIALNVGQTITVEDAIKALVVKSANNVATVVAEKLGGTEYKFAVKMTERARAMGLKRTKFNNASGLPDSGQYSTARDLSILARRVVQDFPQYYHYFNLKSFTWQGRVYKTHNNVLKTFKGADGIKTGYIRASGFNIITSVRRDGYHLIAIVMGGRTKYSRDDHVKLILTNQFQRVSANPNLISRSRELPVPMAKPGTEGALIAQALSPKPGKDAAEPLGKPGVVASLVDPDPIGDLIEIAEEEQLAAEQARSSVVAFDLSGLLHTDPQDPLSPKIVSQTNSVFSLSPTSNAYFAIQVGAYRYEEIATERLNSVKAKAEDALDDAVLAIFPASVDERLVYRARIGPYTKAEAETVCQTLNARGLACYPVFKEEWPLNNARGGDG